MQYPRARIIRIKSNRDIIPWTSNANYVPPHRVIKVVLRLTRTPNNAECMLKKQIN